MPSFQTIPFYNPLDPTYPRIWPDYKLIMPVCAVANIGQLACDLIISTLLDKKEAQLIGRIYSPALMPVVGPNAFSLRGPPTSSTEVYESKKHKLIIIQQRTTYFKNLKQIYINELVNWIKESNFDNVLVLTSSFAQCNPDTSVLGGPILLGSIHSIQTSLFEPDDRWKRVNLKPVPDVKHLKLVKEDGLTYLPGSGMTKALVKAFEKAFIPASFIVDFCSEGMNMEDCYEVVNIVDSLIGLAHGRTGGNKLPEQFQKIVLDLNAATGDINNDNVSSLGDWVQPFSWSLAE